MNHEQDQMASINQETQPSPTKKSGQTSINQENKPSPAKKTGKIKYLSRRQANTLVVDSEIAIRNALQDLDKARELASRAGLSVDSTIVPKVENLESTGGHSNTDHVVARTGDERLDRIAELKRNMLRRHRSMQPEHRGEDRWNKPRIPGERRRRIVREKDLPEAPPPPPQTGYVVFVGQMTTKVRHDRPNQPHDQAKVVQEISKIWRIGMTEEDREYYNEFSQESRTEYDKQVVEYRATGYFTPSREFIKLPEVNVWVRQHRRNGLEREISDYVSCQFPKRPASMDQAYEIREERSKLRRKLKIKGLLNEDGTLKDDSVDFEELLVQERARTKDRENGILENVDEDVKKGQDNEDEIIGIVDEENNQALFEESPIEIIEL